eukprot:scaffold2877_cov377-Pavlova_lutheri.AAC.5
MPHVSASSLRPLLRADSCLSRLGNSVSIHHRHPRECRWPRDLDDPSLLIDVFPPDIEITGEGIDGIASGGGRGEEGKRRGGRPGSNPGSKGTFLRG